VELNFVPGNAGQTRGELIDWFDRVIYALDADDVRDGSAFAGAAADPGFLIQRMVVENADLPLNIHATDAEPLLLSLAVEGWFWPVGESGQAGAVIGEIRIRGVVHPVTVEPAQPNLIASGPAVTLTIAFDTRGTARVTADTLDHAPFGTLSVRVQKVDGTAGDGILSGGDAGADGARLLTVSGGMATVDYTPPATPASEALVLALDDGEGGGEGGRGLEIGRFPLIVRAAP
jgi:hypothetical protein